MADDKKTDSGEAEVQAKVDEENEQGFRGTAVDPTPRDNYTLRGVGAGKPTPRPTTKAAAAAREAPVADAPLLAGARPRLRGSGR
jgi:hypothetical protein